MTFINSPDKTGQIFMGYCSCKKFDRYCSLQQQVNQQSRSLWELIPVKIIPYFVHSLGKRKRVVDDAAVAEITNKLAACNINVSDISLEVRSLINMMVLKGKCQGNIKVFSKICNTIHFFIHTLCFLEDY